MAIQLRWCVWVSRRWRQKKCWKRFWQLQTAVTVSRTLQQPSRRNTLYVTSSVYFPLNRKQNNMYWFLHTLSFIGSFTFLYSTWYGLEVENVMLKSSIYQSYKQSCFSRYPFTIMLLQCMKYWIHLYLDTIRYHSITIIFDHHVLFPEKTCWW